MRLARLFACITAFLLFAAISTRSQTSSQTAPAKPKTSATTAAKSAVSTAASYDRTLLKPSLLKAKAPDTFQAKFETTRGDFTITVTRAWSPLGADRFYNLVKHHFYDNARVYRVVPNFVAQFGISATPPVNAAWQHATIKDDSRGQSNKKGTVVFATSGPNTRTTQLFINLKDNSSLDSMGFTPFGAVDGNGLNVVGMFYDQYYQVLPNGQEGGAGMDQEAMEKGGEKYIATKWPKLDTIKKAFIVGEPAETKPAAATPKPKPTTPK